MNKFPSSKQSILKISLIIVGVTFVLIAPFQLPAKVGVLDFRPYWSSSFLLAHGQDFSNLEKIDNIERTLTGWNEPLTMYAWFAPTGNLILLPFIFFPFIKAAYYWLVTNVVILFLSAYFIWRNSKIHAWIPFVATFGFQMTILSLIFGQINTLVLFGLALFLYFTETNRHFASGASLVLTTIKAHLVILTLPLLLLNLVRRRQWRALAGFAGALIGCALILFILYPAWPVSFWRLVTLGMSDFRQTPTLAGLLAVAGKSNRWGKILWVVGLFFAIIIWRLHKKEWDQRTLIDITILGGMMTAPIGWSPDQVMLLIPILRILEWSVNGAFSKKDAIAAVMALIIINAISIYERASGPNDVWFFWVPYAVTGVYAFAWKRRRMNLQPTPQAI